MGGPSGPTLSFRIAAIRSESVGPEGPPTKTLAAGRRPTCDPLANPRAAAPPPSY
ncbi:DUF6053 domain-containing protein [Lysobacter yananisis]|uniref:DUF6053 domain-containing protein n=1 Tax=Lysobacter yananisis TaxID=1003114 RepID=UPI003CE575A8